MLRSPVVSKRCPSQSFSAIVRMIDMTSLKDLQALYDYGYWANGKLFEVVSQLTPEEFTQSVAGSYGSVRNTMVHVLSAEWGWRDRCGGAQRGPALVAFDYPTGGVAHRAVATGPMYGSSCRIWGLGSNGTANRLKLIFLEIRA
jgi:hypothetical protein